MGYKLLELQGDKLYQAKSRMISTLHVIGLIFDVHEPHNGGHKEVEMPIWVFMVPKKMNCHVNPLVDPMFKKKKNSKMIEDRLTLHLSIMLPVN